MAKIPEAPSPSEFEREIAGKLNLNEDAAAIDTSYSEAYKKFRTEQLGGGRSFYERLCQRAAGLKLKVKISDEKRAELNSYFSLAHIDVTPEGVYTLAYLVTLIGFLFTIVSLFVLGIGAAIAGLILTLIAFFVLPQMPKYIYNTWRAQASDQLVLAVLYMVIYMKRDSNLENAILFVAKQLPPPISLDFMKILWDLETKTHTTIRESMEHYVAGWKDKAGAFVDAMHLIEASLTAPDNKQAKSLLSKATDTIIQGTQDSMIKYAHSLQNPVNAIHMIGIVLPILLLVMLPMVSAFMGDIIKPVHLFIGYDVILPIILFMLIQSVVKVRPGGTSANDIRLYKDYKERPGIKLGRVTLHFPARLAAFGIFLLFLIPALAYLLIVAPVVPSRQELFFSEGLFFVSVLAVAGLGYGLAFYYNLSIRKVIKRKHKTEKLESQFAAAIFQLGSRIQENIPAEMAFRTIADATKGTEVSEFFDTVDSNIRQKGMSLKAAIFDDKVGALFRFPSSQIKSVMYLLIEGVKKSPQAVADSLITISQYLTNMHKVSERLKDLLAETIASMRMQARFLAPLISAIVISLTVLITNILLNLGTQLSQIQQAEGPGAVGGGLGLVSLFSIETAMPPFVFQMIIGIYVIQVIILLSFLLSGVINGRDEIERKWSIARNLTLGTTIYVIATFVASFLFSQIAQTVTGAV